MTCLFEQIWNYSGKVAFSNEDQAAAVISSVCLSKKKDHLQFWKLFVWGKVITDLGKSMKSLQCAAMDIFSQYPGPERVVNVVVFAELSEGVWGAHHATPDKPARGMLLSAAHDVVDFILTNTSVMQYNSL